MLRADVPEARVDEDRELAPREDDVGTHSASRQIKPEVFPEAKAAGVQQPAQLDFGLVSVRRMAAMFRDRPGVAGTGDRGLLAVRPCVRYLSLRGAIGLSVICGEILTRLPAQQISQRDTALSTYTSVEVCAGAGGQALGLEKARFEHLACVEIDPAACQTLRFNRKKWNVIEADLREWEPDLSLVGVDLLAGGVPCPPFSMAGKQLGRDDERDLFPEIIRLAEELPPAPS